MLAAVNCHNVSFSYCNVSSSEIDALHDLFVSANGNDWLWKQVGGIPWNFDAAYPNPCSWQGVFCDEILHYNQSEYNCSVTLLILKNRNLAGSVPLSLSNLTNLMKLNLQGNSISGVMPCTLGFLSNLVSLNLADNFLTGSVPHTLQLLNETITDIALHDNLLSGEISFLGNLRRTDNIFLYNNMLSGTLSNSFCNSSSLEVLSLTNNALSGPVLLCYSSDFYTLDIGYNYFTGSIFIGETGEMGYLAANNNFLTGHFPNELTWNVYMSYVIVNNNYFSGTLPVPGENVLYFYLQINCFTGPVASLISNASISDLQYLDLSNNELTGSIPDDLFATLPYLVSFSVASNCITGTIPSRICSLPSLIYLSLDGLSTAQSCRYRFFPKIQMFTSFSLKSQISGGIPICLFNMSALSTLHLSGNSIEWSFPSDLVVSSSIVNVSLSHNEISGEIPDGIQLKQWSNLDLSYNKLVGIINPDIDMTSNASLVLQVNRLSGSIPNKLMNLKSINILTGNLFSCNFDRDDLPVNDFAYAIYQCGSNSFNQASMMWCACGVVLVVILVVAYASHRRLLSVQGLVYIVEKCTSYMKVFDNENGNQRLHGFSVFVLNVKSILAYLTCGILVAFLPLYTALTHYYKTAKYQYAWTVSAAFLSGSSPAIILLFSYLLFILALFGTWFYLLRKPAVPANNSEAVVFRANWKQQICLSAVVTLNCIVMTLVNTGYVVVILTFDTQIIFATQVATALFKLLWNDFAVRGLMLLARKYHTTPEEAELMMSTNNVSTVYERSRSKSSVNDNLDDVFCEQEMPYMTFIVLFNSIVAPCLATAAVDSNCFYNLFIAPHSVTSVFPTVSNNQECFGTQFLGNSTCSNATESVSYINVSYDPPFIYSYQCSSSILTNYASVYVLMFIMVAFLKPLALMLMVKIYATIPKQSLLYVIIDNTIYNLMKPATENQLKTNMKLFHTERFVLRTVGKIAVFVTFGVVFPPLAAVLCVAFFTETYLNLIIIGRFLGEIKDPLLYVRFKERLSHECQDCMDLLLVPLVRLVVPFAALFYGLFVFDTYGDTCGFKAAIWAPVLLVSSPFFLWCGYSLSTTYCERSHSKPSTDTLNEIELITVENIVLKGKSEDAHAVA